VAAELGFADPYFFSRTFKRHIGASPLKYRAKAVE
jgi:transcriptional regulator GlxA family with amidase domain